MPVHALTIHADYRCRHSGICCASDWDVPVEVPIYRSLETLLSSGRLQPSGAGADGDPPLIVGPDLPEDAGAMLARTDAGACVFFHGSSRMCVVHRDHGEAVLPATCRHFPRLAVRDARGTSISLTHYCPTAASMLFRDDVALGIVEAPPAFPPGEYEGLDVDADAWPPLLHPRMLMDHDGYAAWERHMVGRCGGGATPEDIIATLERDARLLRRWTPADGPLAAAVRALPQALERREAPDDLHGSLVLFREASEAVPDDLKPAMDEDGLEASYASAVRPAWGIWRAPLTNYLAAKAFANWTAYQGRGILAIVRGLEAALAIVRVESARQCRDAGRLLDEPLLRDAIRQTDFLLNHLAVGEDLAAAWSRVED